MEETIRKYVEEVLTCIDRERGEADRKLRENPELTKTDRVILEAEIAAWDKTLEILNDSGFKPSAGKERSQDIESALRRIERMRESTIRLSIVRPYTDQEREKLNTKSNVYDKALGFLADKGLKLPEG